MLHFNSTTTLAACTIARSRTIGVSTTQDTPLYNNMATIQRAPGDGGSCKQTDKPLQLEGLPPSFLASVLEQVPLAELLTTVPQVSRPWRALADRALACVNALCIEAACGYPDEDLSGPKIPDCRTCYIRLISNSPKSICFKIVVISLRWQAWSQLQNLHSIPG